MGMNKNIEKLYQLAAKSSRTIIGLMSGTLARWTGYCALPDLR